MSPRLKSLDDVLVKYRSIFDSLNSQSDMICAVVTTAYLEHLLGSMLQTHFVGNGTATNLLGENGPLGTLSNRARLCYCLGFISSGCMDTIVLIGIIRNALAHGLGEETFDSPTSASDCRKLKSPFLMPSPIPENYEPMEIERAVTASPRWQFKTTMALLCSTVSLASYNIKKAEKATDLWGP